MGVEGGEEGFFGGCLFGYCSVIALLELHNV